MRALLIIYLHVWLSTVVAVYDENHMIVIDPDILYKPTNISYFGYSIGFFNEELYISAPGGDDENQIYKYTINSNALYKTTLSVKPEMHIPKKYKIQNWFGATIKKGSSFLIICAPRAPAIYSIYTVTTGKCVKIHQNSSLPVQLPLLLKPNSEEFNYGIDSYGWSLEVDKFDQVLVGGPAIVRKRNSGLKIHHDDTAEPTLAKIKDKLNLGYSVASGYFLSNISITYAVSTTYGEHGEGEILFFDKTLAFIEKLDSGEVGSMYGAALASACLTGARSSLVVGAPTWAGSGYNTGAVFVYVPVNETRIMLKRIINGTASGGQFGISIANIGDLDDDKIDDFAIGAPYEGKGAVYIYTGFGILAGNTWWRKIQPETFNSFGFSLVPVPKTHKKECNNLGVGAPLSNRAFILKCLPVTTIHLYTIHPNLKLRSNFSYYEFDVCLNVTHPPNDLILQIQINVDVSHSTAKLEKNKGEIIKPLQKFCEKYVIFTPIEGNYDEHIKLDISAALKSSSDDTSPAVLSDRSVTSLKESLWVANCVLHYGRCTPNLDVRMTNEMTVPYQVGLKNTEKFNLTVTNSGESAYNAYAVVTVGSASIRSMPAECSRNVTGKQIICKPSRWIPRGETWDINDIEIEINSVTNNDRNIDIHYDVYGRSGDDGTKQSKAYLYPLVFSFNNINIIGHSSSGKVVNVTDQDVRNGKHFQHVYTICNNGPVDLIGVTCEIALLKKSYLQYSKPKMTQQKDNNDTLSESCAINKERESEEFVRMVCNFSMLPRSSETSIVLPLHILPNNFGAIRTENGTVFTSMDLQIPSNDNKIYIKTISTTTTLLLETTLIPTWVWIISIFIALPLLIIVILILREYNCFQRKNKKNLEELRKTVRRRSTHRNQSGTSKYSKEN